MYLNRLKFYESKWVPHQTIGRLVGIETSNQIGHVCATAKKTLLLKSQESKSSDKYWSDA
jgi:hypothetical protein